MTWSEHKDKNERINIMIVDDHDIVRQAIVALLERENDFRIVFEARNGQEAVESYEHAKPDVVLMDVIMPVMNGIDAAKMITSNYRNSKIIMLTSVDSSESIASALSSGAKGYCLKSVSAEHLADGVRIVFGGEMWLCSNVSNTKEKKKQTRSKKKPLRKTVVDKYRKSTEHNSSVNYSKSQLKESKENFHKE